MTAKELKNSILQLAIEGKLVEQRKEEGSAEDLYAEIQKEKAKLIKAGKIKKEKPLPEITEDEIPFEIPKSWKWVRLGSLVNAVNGFTPLRTDGKYWKNGNIPWFTVDDAHMQGSYIKNDTIQHITKAALNNSTDRLIPKDTVLLCCTSATIGSSVITYIECTSNQQWNGLVVKNEYKKHLFTKYIYLWTLTIKNKMLSLAGTTTFPFLSISKLNNFEFPLPPIAEQKRIVAKIEELLPLIEKYKKLNENYMVKQ